MKAMRLRQPGGLDHIYLGSAESRPAGPGEIRVRVRASSLNFHDFLVALGKLPADEGRILMSDAGGEVVEVGAGVTEFAVGDPVASTFFPDWQAGRPTVQNNFAMPGDHTDGYACEEVTVPATSFTKAPAGYSHAEAATLSCAGLTAWRALMADGGLKAGDTVLVQGTGGVSVFALQFAKAAGATVIATSSSDEKLARLKALGADGLINYRSTPEWGQQVLQLTGGRGVDHVVEVGGPGTLPQSIAACALGAHIAMIGVLTGGEGPVPTAQLLRKHIRLQGLMVGNREQQQDMVRAIEATGIRPVIDSHFPLEDLAKAFAHQASGSHFGKICIDI